MSYAADLSVRCASIQMVSMIHTDTSFFCFFLRKRNASTVKPVPSHKLIIIQIPYE